jgi:hypothetical protein
MIDFDKLRVSTTYEMENLEAKKILTNIPVRKPKKLEFFRIRGGDDWVFDSYILDLQDGEEEKYLVAPNHYAELLEWGLLKKVRFYFGIVHGSGVVFLSDVTLPDADGKHNTYNKSRMEHYNTAKTKWVKISANKELGAYDIFAPSAILPEPEWPEKPVHITDALQIAFKDRYIDSEDHPILRRLRGDV